MDTTLISNVAFLFQAIEAGDVDTVRRLLAGGLSPKSISVGGASALYAATTRGNSSLVRMLLDTGADVNAIGTDPMLIKGYGTPLNHACTHGFTDVVMLLLERGADPCLTSEVSGNAAHHLLGYASARRRPPPEAIDAILERMFKAGLPADACDAVGLSLARHVVTARSPASTMLLVLAHGADPHSRNVDDGSQLIHSVAARSRIDLVDALVKHGIDVNAADGRGQTPIFYIDSAVMVDALVSVGANLAHLNDQGRSVFHAMIDNGTPGGLEEVLLRLLSHGVDPHLPDNDGVTAFELLESLARNGDESARTLCNAVTANSARSAMRAAIAGNVGGPRPR